MRTRIAPTPSGFLHVGNAVNFLLTDWLARAQGGAVLLRIDDFDTGRTRRDYLADIFEVLGWLGVRIHAGPSGPDRLGEWSMAAWAPRFRCALLALLESRRDVAFVCRCSRRELQAGRCAAGCRESALPLHPGRTLVRLAVPADTEVVVGGRRVPVPAADHVLWRRDDLPAYQLGSVVADEALGITTVVRGVDLWPSSALQVHLAGLLPAPGFAAADLRHHGLLTGDDGTKLSKSAGAGAHPLVRTPDLAERIRRWAEEVGGPIGINPP